MLVNNGSGGTKCVAHLRQGYCHQGDVECIARPWYEQIQQEALRSAVLHADESGWRVNGKTNWLWSFSTSVLTCFMIDRSRGRPALTKLFFRAFRELWRQARVSG